MDNHQNCLTRLTARQRGCTLSLGREPDEVLERASGRTGRPASPSTKLRRRSVRGVGKTEQRADGPERILAARSSSEVGGVAPVVGPSCWGVGFGVCLLFENSTGCLF